MESRSDKASRPTRVDRDPSSAQQADSKAALKREIAGLSYQDQVERLSPSAQPAPAKTEATAVQPKAEATAVQMVTGGGGGKYPTGQNPASRTEDELWEDCSDKVTLKASDGTAETDDQKQQRMKLAEAELKKRFNPNMVKAILSHDRGQTPRSFASLVAEDGLGLGGHSADRHVYGTGSVTDKKTLALRVCLHVPAYCPGKAGAFGSVSDGDTAVSAAIKAKMEAPDQWKLARAKLVRGSKWPITVAATPAGDILTKADSPKKKPYQNKHLPPYATSGGQSGRPLYPGDPELASLPKKMTKQPNKPLTRDVPIKEVYVRVVANTAAPGGWYVNSSWPQ